MWCRLTDLLAERPRSIAEVEEDRIGLLALGFTHQPFGLTLISDHLDAVVLENLAQSHNHDRILVAEQDPQRELFIHPLNDVPPRRAAVEAGGQ